MERRDAQGECSGAYSNAYILYNPSGILVCGPIACAAYLTYILPMTCSRTLLLCVNTARSLVNRASNKAAFLSRDVRSARWLGGVNKRQGQLSLPSLRGK